MTTSANEVTERALNDALTVYESFGPAEARGGLRTTLAMIQDPPIRLMLFIDTIDSLSPLFTDEEITAIEDALAPHTEAIEAVLQELLRDTEPQLVF